MKINDIEWLIKKSWSSDTCFPDFKDEWKENDPSYGQSLVTSLLVNDFFGGEIAKCMSSTGGHYYNLIEGKIIDLTISQFHGESILFGNFEIIDREELLGMGDHKQRYHLFLDNMKENADLLSRNVSKVLDSNFNDKVLERSKK